MLGLIDKERCYKREKINERQKRINKNIAKNNVDKIELVQLEQISDIDYFQEPLQAVQTEYYGGGRKKYGGGIPGEILSGGIGRSVREFRGPRRNREIIVERGGRRGGYDDDIIIENCGRRRRRCNDDVIIVEPSRYYYDDDDCCEEGAGGALEYEKLSIAGGRYGGGRY